MANAIIPRVRSGILNSPGRSNPLCLFFGIMRDRGLSPPQTFETSAGERIRISHDGRLALDRPSYKEVASDDGIRVEITARTKNEARKMLAGVKRKYPRTDVCRYPRQCFGQHLISKGSRETRPAVWWRSCWAIFGQNRRCLRTLQRHFCGNLQCCQKLSSQKRYGRSVWVLL